MIRVKDLLQECKREDGAHSHNDHEENDNCARSLKTVLMIAKKIQGIDRNQQVSSQQEVETDVGEEEVIEEVRKDVIFVVGPGNNGIYTTEVRIEKRVMIQRSPYFRQLISSLDQGKLIRILLPKWVRNDFFQTFVQYLNHEDSDRLSEAFSLFLTQPLDAVQRLLWLADFFQILDMQRFLIVEVILTKLTPSSVLTFLGDASKKLKNNQANSNKTPDDLELWIHFERQLTSYLAQNLEEVLFQGDTTQANNAKSILIDLLGYQRFEDLVDKYLEISNGEGVSNQFVKDIIIDEVQGGRLFGVKQDNKCIRKPDEIKQLLWEVTFSPQPLQEYLRLQHDLMDSDNKVIIQEKHSHIFTLFDTHQAKLKARLQSDGLLMLQFALIPQEEQKYEPAIKYHHQARTPVPQAVPQSQRSRSLSQTKGSQVHLQQHTQKSSSKYTSSKPKVQGAMRAKSQSLCSPTMKFSMKDILSKYQQIIESQQTRRPAVGIRSLSAGSTARHLSRTAPVGQTNVAKRVIQQASSTQVHGSRNNPHQQQELTNKRRSQKRQNSTWGSSSRFPLANDKSDLKKPTNVQIKSSSVPRELTQSKISLEIPHTKLENKLPQTIEPLVVNVRIQSYHQPYFSPETHTNLILALKPVPSSDDLIQLVTHTQVNQETILGMHPEDKIHLGLYFSLERSLRDTLCLRYLLDNLHNNTGDLMNQLSLQQIRVLFHQVEGAQMENGDDLKLRVLDAVATQENIEEVESTFLGMINFDRVSTQTIIDIIKSNSMFMGSTYLVSSPKSARLSATVSVLSQSIPFKQHFKNQLRLRKEATILGTASGTPEWGHHGNRPSSTPSMAAANNILSNHLFTGKSNPIKYASPETSIEDDITKHQIFRQPEHISCLSIPQQQDMSEKLAISILSSPINYEAQKRMSIHSFKNHSPINQSSSNPANSSSGLQNSMTETGNFQRLSKAVPHINLKVLNQSLNSGNGSHHHVQSIGNNSTVGGYFTSDFGQSPVSQKENMKPNHMLRPPGLISPNNHLYQDINLSQVSSKGKNQRSLSQTFGGGGSGHPSQHQQQPPQTGKHTKLFTRYLLPCPQLNPNAPQNQNHGISRLNHTSGLPEVRSPTNFQNYQLPHHPSRSRKSNNTHEMRHQKSQGSQRGPQKQKGGPVGGDGPKIERQVANGRAAKRGKGWIDQENLLKQHANNAQAALKKRPAEPLAEIRSPHNGMNSSLHSNGKNNNTSVLSPKNLENVHTISINGQQEGNKRNNSQQFFIDLKALSKKLQEDIDMNKNQGNQNPNTITDQTGFSTSNMPYIQGPPLDDPLLSNTSLQLLQLDKLTTSNHLQDSLQQRTSHLQQSYLNKHHNLQLMMTGQSAIIGQTSFMHQTQMMTQDGRGTAVISSGGGQNQQKGGGGGSTHKQIIVNRKNHVRNE